MRDAQQEAAVALARAVVEYDPARSREPEHYPFIKFLRRRLRTHLGNHFRKHFRGERHLNRRLTLENLEHIAATSDRGLGCLLSASNADPEFLARAREALTRVELIMSGLSAELRLVWRGLLAGTDLHAIAAEMGVSYDAAKRMRRTLKRIVMTVLHIKRD